MAFKRDQSINIVYPNVNNPFVFAHLEKKLDSFHERSSSRKFPTKRKVEMLFSPETKASISCIPMGTTHLSMFVVKETRFLALTKFIPFIPKKTKGLNVFFSKPKH